MTRAMPKSSGVGVGDVEIEALGQFREVHGAGGAVNPGDAVNEEAGAERAEDEVFHPGFERADVAAHVGDEDVEGDGDEFERDEGSGEILGGGEPHHAGAGEDGQAVELAGAVFRIRMIGEAGEDLPVIDGEQQDEDGGDEGEDLVEFREAVEVDRSSRAATWPRRRQAWRPGRWRRR